MVEPDSPNTADSALHHLPIRARHAPNHQRDSSADNINNNSSIITTTTTTTTAAAGSKLARRRSKQIPESLHFPPPGTFRLRSPTGSSIASSISSALFPDSATTCSASSTVASPLSTSYASDGHDLFAGYNLDNLARTPKFCHRQQPSSGSSFTFVNDDEGDDRFASDLEISLSKPGLCDRDETPSQVKIEQDAISLSSTYSDSPKDEEDVSTPCEPPKQETPLYNCDSSSPPQWETSSTTSDDFSPDDADTILDYTLQVVYGMDLQDTPIPPGISRQLVGNFVRDIGRFIRQAASDSQQSNTVSVSTTPSQGGSADGSYRGEKRKKQGKGDEEGDGFSDGGGSGYLPVKRPRPNPREEENLRLSCPYRKKNPHRFNVRDHHSCAMTYFPKFAELRQHIVKQHKRDDPSAFVCDRCNRDFTTRKELRDHQRLPKEYMCDITDHDPESGIDGPTSNKLLSRKRASGSSPEVQWKEIWNILFPDDEDDVIQPYHFTPVIEHFELSSHYLSSFKYLEASLRDKISNQATLETLATKFHQCFVETVERCIADAQSLPYVNRSNKRNEPTRNPSTQQLIPRKGRGAPVSRPDSGVVLDDGSEESGSIIGEGSTSLTWRDSVRTVRGRSSQITLDPVRELTPALAPNQGIFDADLLHQFTNSASGIDFGTMQDASMQAWSNSVMMPYGPQDPGLVEQIVDPGVLTPQTDLPGWEQASLFRTDFGSMGEGFAGFNAR